MKVLETDLPGCVVIEPHVHGDARGYFYESFNAEKYRKAGLDLRFVQANVSRSAQGVLRGLLLLGHSHPQNDVRALGRLGLGYPRLYPCKLRALVASKDPRQRLRAIKDRNRPIAPCYAPLLGFASERCLDGKAWHEDAGKKHD